MTFTKAALISGVLLVVCGVGSFTPESVRAQEVLTPDQIRMRIMDSCMVALSREVSQLTPTYPACQCYATGLTKIMDDKDRAAFAKTGQVSSRLTPQAKEIYAACRK